MKLSKQIATWKNPVYGISGTIHVRIPKTGLELSISPAWNNTAPVREFESKKELKDAIVDVIEQIDIHGLTALVGKSAKRKPGTGETLVSVEFGGDTHKPVKMTMIFESKADFRKWKKSAADDLSAYYDKIKVIDPL